MADLRRIGAVIGAVALAGTLASCNSHNNNDKTPSATTSHTKTTISGGTETTVPTQVPNDTTLRQDVTLSSCVSSPGGWVSGGAIINHLSHSATFKLTVFFTNTQATDLAFATTSVVLAPGKASLWQAKATFAAPSQVLCVLRGVSAS